MEKFTIKCTNGLLKVYEDKAVISRNTAMGFVTQGLKGDKGEQGIAGTNGTDGEAGFSPTIIEKTNTDTEYVLTITNKTGIFDTPNLKGQDGISGSGEGGTTNYNELINKPSINNIELSGNKTLEDLGIISNIPHRKNITLLSTGWQLNETTGKYEYRIDDTTITENDDIDVRIEDEEQEEAFANAEPRLYSYDGYYVFTAKELIEINIEAELVITRTKATEVEAWDVR